MVTEESPTPQPPAPTLLDAMRRVALFLGYKEPTAWQRRRRAAARWAWRGTALLFYGTALSILVALAVAAWRWAL
jgi:hypothetical protein